MLNSKGNQKKTKPAGQGDSTLIVALAISTMEKFKEDVKTFSYTLDARGSVTKDAPVNDNYVVIRAYDNEEKINKLRKAKKEKQEGQKGE